MVFLDFELLTEGETHFPTAQSTWSLGLRLYPQYIHHGWNHETRQLSNPWDSHTNYRRCLLEFNLYILFFEFFFLVSLLPPKLQNWCSLFLTHPKPINIYQHLTTMCSSLRFFTSVKLMADQSPMSWSSTSLGSRWKLLGCMMFEIVWGLAKPLLVFSFHYIDRDYGDRIFVNPGMNQT